MEYENKNENKQIQDKNGATKKILTILGLILVLIIPLSLVKEQIWNRQGYEAVAQKDVAKSWGDNVILSAPMITSTDRKIYPVSGETIIEVASKEKERGIFRVPVYIVKLKTLVSFPKFVMKKIDANKNKKLPVPDYLNLSVKPLSSIQSVKIKELPSGKELKANLVEDVIKISADEITGKDFSGQQIEIEISMRGTGTITYESNADHDKVHMIGNWTRPKFVEEILPIDTKLSTDGFEAFWTLNALSKWENGPREFKSIGLNHLWISTDYSMLEKSIKYGILFISLTFLVVFIVEFISGLKIHPLQYGTIGLSISLFYLLLLALSEMISFDFAYLISSLSVTSLIIFYMGGFLKQKKFVKIMFLEQIILSTFFYILLSLEKNAFLIGTLGLFAILALFMIITRRFDWYSGELKLKVENPQTIRQP